MQKVSEKEVSVRGLYVFNYIQRLTERKIHAEPIAFINLNCRYTPWQVFFSQQKSKNAREEFGT